MTSPSRIGIPVNLPAGSTYDMLVVRTEEGYPKGKLTFEFENAPRKITGLQKVAQTFLRVLFTSKGSDVLNRYLGTEFPDLVVGANRRTNERTFTLSVNSAIQDAESQTKRILNGVGYSPSSQLERIEFTGFDLGKDSLRIYLKMITKAGEFAAIAVPFPELDLKLTNG